MEVSQYDAYHQLNLKVKALFPKAATEVGRGHRDNGPVAAPHS